MHEDSPYDGEIAYVDHCIDQVINKLKALKLYDSSLLIITADHGEGLGDHSEDDHGYFIYQSVMHVPLIIKPPFCDQGERIKNYTGIIDIAPTILSYAGIEPPDVMQGNDLSGLIDGDETAGTKRYYLCESLYPATYSCNPLLSITGDGYKYIQSSQSEFYDLSDDPAESVNLADVEPGRLNEFRKRLGKLLQDQISAKAIDSKQELDSQNRKRLRSLGYVDSDIEDSYTFDPDKPDAKDYIDYHRLSQRFNLAMKNKQYQLARQIHEKLSELYPGERILQHKSGFIAYEQERYAEAIEHFNKVFAETGGHIKLLIDETIDGYAMRGMSYYNLQKYEEAAKDLKKALEYSPDDALLHSNLAMTLQQIGRVGEAIVHFKAALELGDDNAVAHAYLGEVLAQNNKLEEAISQYNKALKISPDNWRIHASMGRVFAMMGRFQESMTALTEAKRLCGDNPQAQAILQNMINQIDSQL